MAYRVKNTRKAKQQKRGTNWMLIVGIFIIGVVGLFSLLAMNLQGSEILSLEARCQENPAACVAVGAADAPVKIIEVLYFGCTHCRDFHEQTFPLIDEEYIQSGQVQFIYYPYALSGATIPAASASLCANEQGAYTAFADALFAQYDEPDARERSGLLRAAETAGVDVEAFASCLDDGRHETIVRDNIEIARQNRITSTPTFLVNGREIAGALPFVAFQRQIENILNS